MTSREAQLVFAEYLERLRLGTAPELEAFCADHPAHHAELRELHRVWTDATQLNSSFLQRLSEKHGEDVDPGISLDHEPSQSRVQAGSDDALELIEKIAAMSTDRRYAIKGELARGGMGMVYKVWDRDLRRNLAMKVVLGRETGGRKGSSDGVDRERLSRFLEEAQITGQLDHPGIVPVHELGLDSDGRIFFTMRLVKGKELREILKEYHQGVSGGTLTRAVQLIQKVCDAVAYAHEKGVIHRDLKPANVMVGRFGEVYVMDWGLAKVLSRQETPSKTGSTILDLTMIGGERAHEDAPQTVEGAIFGTPSYMAPEQARGELERLGTWSDVYSIGSILYHLLTGRMPYVDPGEPAKAHAVLAQLLHGPPRPILECNPHVPGELVAICEKAMHRDPAARYASLVDMRSDLQAWLEGRVVQAYETGALAGFRKWVARNKAMAGALGLIVLLAVGGTSGFAWQQNRQARRLALEQRQTLEAKTAAEESAAHARRQSYVANVIAADVHLRSHEVGEARRRLAACEPSLRGWEWSHVALKSDSSIATLTGSSDVTCVAATSDLEHVATGSSDFAVRLWDPAAARVTGTWTGHSGAVVVLDFTPGGERLASGSEDGTARIWDVASGQTLHVLRGHEATIASLAFDGPGNRLVTGGRDRRVRVWDADTGRQILEFEPGEEPVESVAISPDGTLIAAGTTDGHLSLWDAASATARIELDAHDAPVTGLAFAPGAARLASSSLDGRVCLWDVEGGELALELAGHGDPVLCVAFSPDGRQLATGSLDKALRLCDAGSGTVLQVLNAHDEPVRSLAYDGSGARIVTGSDDGSVRLWAADVGAASTSFSVGEEPVAALALAPDSRRVAASARFSGTIRVWDARSSALLLEIPGPDDGVLGLCFTPDGERLIAGLEDRASLLVLDSRSGEPLLEPLEGHEASITAVACSSDGALIASASADGSVRLWEARTGRALHVLGNQPVPMTSVAFSPDGSAVAAGAMDGRLRTWGCADGLPRLELEAHPGSLQALAYSPSGDRVATASLDGSLRLWNASSGALVAELAGHSEAIYALAFSSGGERLTSASFDRTLVLWDVASLEPLLSLRGHGGPVVTAAFSSDGVRLASGALDGNVILWETEPPAARYRARRAQELVSRRRAELPDLERVADQLASDAQLDVELRREALELVGLLRAAR